MEPIQIFVALLTAAAGVSALTSSRVYPLQLPLGTQYPALVIAFDNDDALPTIDASSPYGMRQAEVDVIVFAKLAGDLQTLKLAVEAACKFQRGVIGGINVVSISDSDTGGPAFDSRFENWFLTVHFTLTYRR